MEIVAFIVLLAAVIVGFIHFYAPAAAPDSPARPWGHRSLLALSIVLFEIALLLQFCWTSAGSRVHW